MHCPYCQHEDTRVVDSRIMLPQNNIRRRRECPICSARFTTFEMLQFNYPRVIKRSGETCQFSEIKLKNGIMRALEKRPINTEDLEKLFDQIQYKICQTPERELTTAKIGEIVLAHLKGFDEVAYLRFASVYLKFQDIAAFKQIILGLEKEEEHS